MLVAEEVDGEDSGAADEDFSNECSNYSEDDDEDGISQDGNEDGEKEAEDEGTLMRKLNQQNSD